MEAQEIIISDYDSIEIEEDRADEGGAEECRVDDPNEDIVVIAASEVI